MKKFNEMKNLKIDVGITLIALVVTIIILLVLAGITISTLGGENGLFAKTKQAKKAHVQSEMQEQLTLALDELQLDKKGNASLDDVTQDWINTVISKDYNPQIKEDASFEGKMVVMNKDDVIGKFLINQNLEISKTEYNVSTLEFEYETEKIENGKVKILINITDKVNGLKQIDYPGPNEDPLIMENRKTPLGIDYYVELGKEYKFVITTGDGNKTEKTIKIDDYYYNVTKDLGESAVIDNNKTKVAYNKSYEATILTEGNYIIIGLTVTMGGQAITTSGNNVIDINTGKIKIEKVTGDIYIKVMTTFNPIIKYNDEKNLTIDVSVTYPPITSNKMQKQYSIDGVNYYEYTEPVKIKDNCTFFARVIDIDTNEVIVSSQEEINNIIYEWEVYSLDRQCHYKLDRSGGGYTGTSAIGTFYTGVSVNYNTGELIFTGATTITKVQSFSWYVGKYIKWPGNCTQKILGVVEITDSQARFQSESYCAFETDVVYTKGSQQYENIKDSNKKVYPADGQQGNYWYVLKNKE